ncbi:M20 family metallo-hydrolase [Curvibacter sp. PAE-UM]|uniref:M20 family metallo-hydrolase n=1 Tax=Curvibacter sp. PAE-UM TaxID=1714344 RepID=UPI000AE81630|nr:M20 family metallo-hydrolase [Curvibacter sp. PAE-UM]
MQTDELARSRAAADRVLQQVDSERLRTAIAELARYGGRDDGGVARETLTEIDLQARRYLIERARALGCSVAIDDCANLFFRRPGRSDLPPVLTGSHVDTQPVGGKLDGAYGVVAGLEVLQALQDAGIQTERPVEVVVWTNEEGSRFGPGCMGSSAYVDPAKLAGYRAVRDGSQHSFGEAVDRALQAMPDVPRRAMQQPLAGFIELHIEQGPVLETAGVPLGVVTGIQSVRWFRVKVSGVAAHAGTTPMDIRTDAMAACIQMAHRLYAEAARRQASGLRLTLGRWVVGPNSINTIPGEVEFTIDMRCVDEGALAEFDAVMRDILQHHAGRTRVVLEAIFERKPTHFPTAMTALVEEACARTCQLAAKPAPLALTSGAFHDAMYLADHCPTAMLFVPSEAGISHNASEQTAHADLVLGAQALAYAVTRMAGA